MDSLGKKINMKYEIDGRVAMQCNAMRCNTVCDITTVMD